MGIGFGPEYSPFVYALVEWTMDGIIWNLEKCLRTFFYSKTKLYFVAVTYS